MATRLRIYAAKHLLWEEKLLAEVHWDGEELVVTGEDEQRVLEVRQLVDRMYRPERGFITYERDPKGELVQGADGKLLRAGYVSRKTHAEGALLDVLAENLEVTKVYRVERDQA